MRYFLKLAYLGTRYCGWQKQPNGVSVQETLETALSVILRAPTDLTGCGRTDAGVHAHCYFAHFDAENPLPERFLQSLNSLLPADIAVQSSLAVPPEAHARYDAVQRSYIYTITAQKDPFRTQTAWFYPNAQRLDLQKMAEMAAVLPQYTDFFAFCKSDSGLERFECLVREARWEQDGSLLRFHISANRFLRGMVRLIVGAAIQTGLGKLSVADIQAALEQRKPPPSPHSVPPEGLSLTDVRYRYPVEPAQLDHTHPPA
jgi:tRNA pseudouridine38-40 synthase